MHRAIWDIADELRATEDENLNETLETVFRHIEESAKGSESGGSFEGMFDDFDVNSNKLGSTLPVGGYAHQPAVLGRRVV